MFELCRLNDTSLQLTWSSCQTQLLLSVGAKRRREPLAEVRGVNLQPSTFLKERFMGQRSVFTGKRPAALKKFPCFLDLNMKFRLFMIQNDSLEGI